jgi:hypothetical protein
MGTKSRKTGIMAAFMPGRGGIYAAITGGANSPVVLLPSGIGHFPPENDAAMQPAIDLLRQTIGNNYAVIRYIIPDPYVSFESFISGGPAAGRRVVEMLAYRSAAKLGIAQKDAMFRVSKTADAGNIFTAGFSAEKTRINEIGDIFLLNGMALSGAEPAIAAVLDKLSEKNDLKDSAVFVFDGMFWTFAVCSAAGMMSFMVSRWHDAADNLAVPFAEIERKLRALTVSQPLTTVKRIYICCSGSAMADGAVRLASERFEPEIIRIDPPEGFAGNEDAEKLPFSVLTAAVCG